MSLVEDILKEAGNPIKECISDETIHALRMSKSFAIWGTGKAAKYAIHICKEKQLIPVCVCDSYNHFPGETFEGVPLLSEKDFFNRALNCVVLICCLSTYGIDKKLDKAGYPYITWNTSLLGALTDQVMPIDQIQENREKIEYVYRILGDKKSQQTYKNVLLYRLTDQQSFISEVYAPQIYFNNDIVKTINCTSFVDCGAYTGDTLRAFFDSPNCKCSTYYAFEPDKNNWKQLCNCVEKMKLHNVKIFQMGVWNKSDVLCFAGNQGEKCYVREKNIDELLQYSVQVDSLDHILEKQRVGFIKMDIEGAEIQAICGAKTIIEQQHPILAISIYHNTCDLWEIPILIKKINPNYKLYIRHHTHFCCDTVVYAIQE